MSLQSDFERCWEYAKELETNQDQLEQAQNNIIFIQKQSEQLKNKLRICVVLSVLSAIVGILILSFVLLFIIPAITEIVSYFDIEEYIYCLIFPMLPCILFVVALFKGIKTKKELKEFETQKPFLIKKYTEDVKDCEIEITRLVNDIHQKNLLDIVPADYFYTAAIEFCLAQIRKQLAYTAKEAFQQLDAEIKRLEQIEYLEQMNDAHLEQLNNIQRAIDINTFITLSKQNNSQY